MKTHTPRQTGSILVTSLVIIGFLLTLAFGLQVVVSSNLARATQRIYLLQAQYAAESGSDIALARINASSSNETCSLTDPSVSPASASNQTVLVSGSRYKATYDVQVVCGANTNEKIITTIGKLYQPANAATPRYSRTIQVYARRTSTLNTNNVLSRNIVEIGSAVKKVIAKDIYVNGYIKMEKNVTVLQAENLTVADKKTSANNCSIEGPGSLAAPTTYLNTGQTTTVVKTAYNSLSKSCVGFSPSASSSYFTILENQTDIPKVQSTYIPWSYKMDSSYTNAGNCSDWTLNASTVNIPAAGSKASHYPDSGSGVVATCATTGSDGSINLRNDTTYVINDNIHLRANLCRSAACRPIFNNPSATTRFIFVEGTIDFQQLRTTSGSGPLVFVSYGPDPASLSSLCPLGGAIRLSQTGTSNTYAPAAFLLAINGGMCLDGTKFSNDKALGGVSGKNLYIATNSGTPFDLRFDPAFPINEVPINLSFKAARYVRK